MSWIVFKVEDSWKTTEFVILPHRDAKDVFILGGTDDIQVGIWVIQISWQSFYQQLERDYDEKFKYKNHYLKI